MTEHECKCSGSGFCKVFNRRMTARDQAICCGKSGLSEPQRSAYLERWGVAPRVAEAKPFTSSKVSSPVVKCRAGTELKKMLEWFGQAQTGECNCKARASEMDERGCDWCEANVETIVGWLREAAEKKSILGFSVASVPGFDMTAEALVRASISKARTEQANKVKSSLPFAYSGAVPEFISITRLGVDSRSLATMLPSNISGIVGIARSGLAPATIVAQFLHLPLKVLRQSSKDGDYSLVDGGNGWRLTGNTGGDGPWVLIDDTVMSGNSFNYSLPAVRAQLGEVLTAALYVNPHSRFQPDFKAAQVPWPHLLEWNMFNSVMTPSMAVDFDGILCHDCPAGSDDDGPRYLDFLRNTRPLYPIRKVEIPMIVTARLERYRGVTIEWLKQHGMAVKKLVMGPWKNLGERTFERVCQHKAKHYSEFLKQRHHVKPPMFVESCPHQARRISEISNGLVVCPAAGKCFLRGQ